MLMTAAIIGPAHGLKGEVVLDVRSDDPAVLAPGASLVLSGSGSGVVVESTRVHKGRVLARLGGVGTREEAEALRGAALLVAPTTRRTRGTPTSSRACARRTRRAAPSAP